MTAKPRPGTIGQLIEYEMSLSVYCGCGHSRSIDLEGLAGKLGRDRSHLNGAIPFRCSRCGGLARGVIVGGSGTRRIRGSYP